MTELHELASTGSYTQEYNFIELIRLFKEYNPGSTDIELIDTMLLQLDVGQDTQDLTTTELLNGLYIVDTEYPDKIIRTRSITDNSILEALRDRLYTVIYDYNDLLNIVDDMTELDHSALIIDIEYFIKDYLSKSNGDDQ